MWTMIIARVLFGVATGFLNPIHAKCIVDSIPNEIKVFLISIQLQPNLPQTGLHSLLLPNIFLLRMSVLTRVVLGKSSVSDDSIAIVFFLFFVAQPFSQSISIYIPFVRLRTVRWISRHQIIWVLPARGFRDAGQPRINVRPVSADKAKRLWVIEIATTA